MDDYVNVDDYVDVNVHVIVYAHVHQNHKTNFRIAATLRLSMSDQFAYVGTYTPSGSAGIYAYQVDAATEQLTQTSTAKSNNPSFLAFHPNKRVLYAVSEEGELKGIISAFAIDPNTGALSFLNQQPTNGSAPCHVVVDASGQSVITANYSSGSLCVFPIAADGTLSPMSDFVQHSGSGPDKARQEGPHAHSVNLSPDNRFVFACDLGLDRVFIYALDAEKGKLTLHGEARTAPGAGPRHFAFHPNGKFAYAINELDSTVTAFRYDTAAGSLSEIQAISTLPEGFSGTSYCADIHVHASGKYVLGSNRGHDSLAIFAVDEATGQLTSLGQTSTGGGWPRNFAIAPSGKHVFVANQYTDNVVQFAFDAATGQLTPTGHVISVPTPVCIKFL